MDKEKTIMLLHVAAGIAAGYLSYIIASGTYALVLAAAVLAAMKYATDVIAKEKKKAGWWLGNGGLVYIFVWFISWVVFLNIL